jgi:hypothetical protein
LKDVTKVFEGTQPASKIAIRMRSYQGNNPFFTFGFTDGSIVSSNKTFFNTAPNIPSTERHGLHSNSSILMISGKTPGNRWDTGWNLSNAQWIPYIVEIEIIGSTFHYRVNGVEVTTTTTTSSGPWYPMIHPSCTECVMEIQITEDSSSYTTLNTSSFTYKTPGRYTTGNGTLERDNIDTSSGGNGLDCFYSTTTFANTTRIKFDITTLPSNGYMFIGFSSVNPASGLATYSSFAPAQLMTVESNNDANLELMTFVMSSHGMAGAASMYMRVFDNTAHNINNGPDMFSGPPFVGRHTEPGSTVTLDLSDGKFRIGLRNLGSSHWNRNGVVFDQSLHTHPSSTTFTGSHTGPWYLFGFISDEMTITNFKSS